MSRLTVLSTALNGAAQLIRSYGVDPDLVAQLAGLDAGSLENVNVPLSAVLRYMNIAATACNEPQFGIELGSHQGLELLGPIWILARHAETVGEALESICGALGLHSSGLSMIMHNQATGAALDYKILTEEDNSDLQAVEQSFALLCKEIRVFAGASWQPHYVRFRHDKPNSLEKHRRVFGGALHFNQDSNVVFVDRVTLDTSINARGAGHRVIQSHVRHLQHLSGQSFATRVAQVIHNLVMNEGSNAPAVAQVLRMSLRTLQHRLALAGTSYQSILDDVRVSLGQRYLSDSRLSVAQIAELLHFSDASAFSRFFRGRTGVAPSEYQRQRKNVDAKTSHGEA